MQTLPPSGLREDSGPQTAFPAPAWSHFLWPLSGRDQIPAFRVLWAGPWGSFHIPRDSPCQSVPVCPLYIGLGEAREEVEGLQSKDHGRWRGGRETLVRPLVLTRSHLLLYRVWRSEGYTATQLPQKAVNPCFIFVESSLWLAFGGSFSPSPDFDGFHILILALVAVEKDLGGSTTDVGPAFPRRSLPILGGSSACPTALDPHLSFYVRFSLSWARAGDLWRLRACVPNLTPKQGLWR